MRIPLVLLVLGVTLAGCATPEPPAAESGQIDGALLDQFMQPYGNTTVRIVELDREDTTSPRGGFTFAGLPPGTYTLEAQPPLAELARERVELEEGGREVVFLQARREVPDPVYKAALGRDANMVAGLPGEECIPCMWTTRLSRPPDEVVLRADWDETLGGPLIVELWDEDGSLLRRIETRPPVWEPVAGDDILGPHLTVRVRLGDDPMPRADLDIHTALDVYYGADRATQE